MSKYTTELRYICETLAGLKESKGYPSVDENKIKVGTLEVSLENGNPIFDFIKQMLPQVKKSSILNVTKDTFEGKYNVDFSDPLLNNDPNEWAIKNAEILDGI